jgi:pilus assembly protein Flp/PilA
LHNSNLGLLKQVGKKGVTTMLNLIAKLQAYKSDERGATAIEYGLIAAGIAVGISAVVFAFGDDLSTLFGDMQTQVGTRL